MTARNQADLRLDLTPVARRMGRLVEQVGDEQLAAPTPCPEYTLGDLIEHVEGLSLAFTWAATKEFPSGPANAPSGDASRLRPGWRSRIAEQLETLATAWKEPSAWEGMSSAGGVDLPGEVAGLVALDELVVHGWDVARASGQHYDVEPELLEPLHQFLLSQPQMREIFGPPVDVGPDASQLDRLIALTGREPGWTSN